MRFDKVLFILILFISCQNSTKDYDLLYTECAGDSLKLQAADFLLSNMGSQHTLKSSYIDTKFRDHSEFLSSYLGAKSSKEVIDSLGVTQFINIVPDSSRVNMDLLLCTINESVGLYRNPLIKYPTSYSREILFNYLLPYRVGFEAPHNWRRSMRLRYTSYLKSFDVQKLSVKKIAQLISLEQEGASRFSLTRRLNSTKIAYNPTIDDIKRIRIPFTCEDYAIRSLYAWRSIGLPSAYEIIPLWGKFNNGHSVASVLFENGKFYPIQNGDTEPFKYQIAKMYRRAYESQTNDRVEIMNCGEQIHNIPEGFDNSHYVDITNERTETSDIKMQVENSNIHSKVVYICVYNNGKWLPVYWSKVNMDGVLNFKKMGKKIMYHLAYYRMGDCRLIKEPFILDSLGVITPIIRKSKKDFKVEISFYDRSSRIEAKELYTLYMWDNEKHSWISIRSIRAILPYINLSLYEGCLYKIVPNLFYESHEEVRPFSIVNNKQSWW